MKMHETFQKIAAEMGREARMRAVDKRDAEELTSAALHAVARQYGPRFMAAHDDAMRTFRRAYALG